MARGKKTSPEVIYRVMASWFTTDSYEKTAEDAGIPASTVKDIVVANKDKPQFVELRCKKREEFSKIADRILRKAAMRLEREIDNEDSYIPVNHLTTVIGKMYDKKALAEGNAIENVSVEIKLPDGVNEYARDKDIPVDNIQLWWYNISIVKAMLIVDGVSIWFYIMVVKK